MTSLKKLTSDQLVRSKSSSGISISCSVPLILFSFHKWPRPHLTALFTVGFALMSFAEECGVEMAKWWMEAERGRNVEFQF